jgi:DNA-binding transcriptional LysR family regulator
LPPPETAVYVETVWSALEVIKHSNVIGFIPGPLARGTVEEICIVPVAEKIPPVKIHAITTSAGILTPAARALMSAIRACAAANKRAPAVPARGAERSRLPVRGQTKGRPSAAGSSR